MNVANDFPSQVPLEITVYSRIFLLGTSYATGAYAQTKQVYIYIFMLLALVRGITCCTD
jgi:hypothetical protein